jgi:mono/diheme cytochrome c family protein
MQITSARMSPKTLRRSLLAFGAIAALVGGAAQAQNLDEGKSPAKLFSDGCATCHRSPSGLAKGRFRLTLFTFLQQHYATSSSSAWALASYLESVEGARGPRTRAAAAKKRSAPATDTSETSPRPPAPMPGH